MADLKTIKEVRRSHNNVLYAYTDAAKKAEFIALCKSSNCTLKAGMVYLIDQALENKSLNLK